jgi:hypothetical protein
MNDPAPARRFTEVQQNPKGRVMSKLVAASSDTGIKPGLMVTMHGDGKGGFKGDHGSRSSVLLAATVEHRAP